MNQWGLWFTFFLPAFLGGAVLGVSATAAFCRYLIRRKKSVRADPSQKLKPNECLERCA